jgi:transcription antitermination factor NusG
MLSWSHFKRESKSVAKEYESTCFLTVWRTLFDEFTWLRTKSGKNPQPSEDGEALPEIDLQGAVSLASRPVLDRVPDGLFSPKWFAVYLSPRHEKRVALHMDLREIEHYLPLYRAHHKWSDGSKVTLDLPLFPGYIFARIKQTERVRVLEVPGVLALVGGTAREPMPLPESEIDALRDGLLARHAEPHPLLTVGQRVRIRSGALCGMEGVVVRKKNSLRVVLTMDLIMESIAVEVDGSELEQVGSNVRNAYNGRTS